MLIYLFYIKLTQQNILTLIFPWGVIFCNLKHLFFTQTESFCILHNFDYMLILKFETLSSPRKLLRIVYLLSLHQINAEQNILTLIIIHFVGGVIFCNLKHLFFTQTESFVFYITLITC